MKLVEPLSKATDILCTSKYPTLNSVLPVYLVLIQHLHTARQGIHVHYLITPANAMIEKINQYLGNNEEARILLRHDSRPEVQENLLEKPSKLYS